MPPGSPGRPRRVRMPAPLARKGGCQVPWSQEKGPWPRPASRAPGSPWCCVGGGRVGRSGSLPWRMETRTCGAHAPAAWRSSGRWRGGEWRCAVPKFRGCLLRARSAAGSVPVSHPWRRGLPEPEPLGHRQGAAPGVGRGIPAAGSETGDRPKRNTHRGAARGAGEACACCDPGTRSWSASPRS